MDRLRNRRGLRSRSRKSHVGVNMLDAAGFTEDEKLEAFRIYDETLKADREREELQMRSALEELVDDRMAANAEEAIRSAPLEVMTLEDDDAELLLSSSPPSRGESRDAAAAAAASTSTSLSDADVRKMIHERVEEGESEEEIRKRILETFLKDADKALEGREEERERQKEATKRRLEEQRRRRREKVVRDRVAKEIKRATQGEETKEEEEEEEAEWILSIRESADAIGISRAEANVEGGVEKRGKWDLDALNTEIKFADENQVTDGRGMCTVV